MMGMRDTIFVRGQQLGVELEQISGRKGAGTHVLSLGLEVQPRRDLAGRSLLLGGDLSITPRNGGTMALAHVHSSSSPPNFVPDGAGELHPRRWDLTCHLTATQLESVEQARSGADLELLLDVNGLVVGEGDAGAVSGQLRFRLEAAVWSRVLEQMQFARMLIILIPFGQRRSSRADKAVARLEHALGTVSAGRYRDAVRECRDLLEALYSDEDAEFSRFKPEFPNQRQARMDARLYVLRRAILMLTHAAAHDDEVSRTFQWERREALCVIGLLGSLLQQEG